MANDGKQISCPDCHGAGKRFGFINGDPDISKHSVGDLRCSRCHGAGTVPMAMTTWIEAGKAIRQDRVRRGETLYSESQRLGISSAALCSIEMGKVDPSSHAQ